MKKHAILMSLRRLHTLLLLEKRSNNLRSDLLKGMDIISAWPEDLSQLEPVSTRVRFAELGPKFIKTYDELLTTGRIERLDELQAQYDPFYCFLCEIPNFGQKMANRMYYDRIIESMDDLRLAFANGVLPQIPAFGEGRLKTIANLLWLTPEGADYPAVDWTLIDSLEEEAEDDGADLELLEDFERPQLLIPRAPKRPEPLVQKLPLDTQIGKPSAEGESDAQRQLMLDFRPKGDLSKAAPKTLPLIEASQTTASKLAPSTHETRLSTVSEIEAMWEAETQKAKNDASSKEHSPDSSQNKAQSEEETPKNVQSAGAYPESDKKSPSKGPRDHSGSLKLSEMPPKRTTSERKPEALHKLSQGIGDLSPQRTHSIVDVTPVSSPPEAPIATENVMANDTPPTEMGKPDEEFGLKDKGLSEAADLPATSADLNAPNVSRGAYGALACPQCKTWHAIDAHASQASYSLSCDHCKTRFLLREGILRLDLATGEQSTPLANLSAVAAVFRKSFKSLSLGRNILIALIDTLRPCDVPSLRILQLGAAHDALFDCLYDVFCEENQKIVVVDESLWSLRVAASTEADQALICSPDASLLLAPDTYDRIVVDPLRYDKPCADLLAKLARALRPKGKLALFWPEDLSQDAIKSQAELKLLSNAPLGKGAILGLEKV